MNIDSADKNTCENVESEPVSDKLAISKNRIVKALFCSPSKLKDWRIVFHIRIHLIHLLDVLKRYLEYLMYNLVSQQSLNSLLLYYF